MSVLVCDGVRLVIKHDVVHAVGRCWHDAGPACVRVAATSYSVSVFAVATFGVAEVRWQCSIVVVCCIAATDGDGAAAGVRKCTGDDRPLLGTGGFWLHLFCSASDAVK